jgi:transcriptional regulator with XRE-family HTH domain
MSFGRTLQNLRNKAGLSQSELAAKAGIPVKTIQSWEISRRTPRWISLLAKLAKGLNVPMESLTVGVDKENEQKPGAEKRARGQPRRGAGR